MSQNLDGFAGDPAERGGRRGEGAAGGGEEACAMRERPEVDDGAAHAGKRCAVGGAFAKEKSRTVAEAETFADGGIVGREKERIGSAGIEKGIHVRFERFDRGKADRLRMVAATNMDADGPRRESVGQDLDFCAQRRDGPKECIAVFRGNDLPPGVEKNGSVATAELRWNGT